MLKKIVSLYRGSWPRFAVLITLYSMASALIVYVCSLLLERLVDSAADIGVWAALQMHLPLLIITLVVAAFYFMLQYLKSHFYNWQEYKVSTHIFDTILKSPYESILEKSAGDVYSVINNDLPLCLSLFPNIESVCTTLAASVGSAIYIFQMDWRMGLVILGFGILIVFYNRIISPQFQKIQSRIQADNGTMKQITVEQYQSFLSRKFYRLSKLDQKYDAAYNRYIDASVKQCKYAALTSIVGYLIGFLQTYFPLFLLSTVFLGYTMGEVLALITNIVTFISIFRAFGRLSINASNSAAGAERMIKLLEMAKLQKGSLPAPGFDRAAPYYQVENLTYHYPNSDFAIQVSDLELQKGQKIAFVGEKGCGKSTFIKILVGLFTNYKGNVQMMGAPLSGLSQREISSKISYMTQEFPVFDGTIYENFQIVAPEKTEQEYLQYAALVNMDQEILQMPQGLHTKISDTSLSTGQRQRISLCMILLRDTPIVIMDEPVSNLDVANKNGFRTLLNQNLSEKLCVLTSHDLEILQGFDQIYKIQNGVIDTGK